MAEIGIKSSDLPRSSTIDEVVGNVNYGGQKLSRVIAIPDLAEAVQSAPAFAEQSDSLERAITTFQGQIDTAAASTTAALAGFDARVAAAESLAASGILWTTAKVRVRSTANVALANGLENGDTVNGVVLVTGDNVFLGSQTDPKENGIYTVVASGAASRAAFADSAAELAHIGFVIQAGTVGAGEKWTLPLSAGAITIGTTALVFAPTGVEPGYGAEVLAARGASASVGARLDAGDTRTGALEARADTLDAAAAQFAELADANAYQGADDYPYAIGDEDGRMAIGIRSDGAVFVAGNEYQMETLTDAALAGSGYEDLVFGVLDEDGRVGFGVREDGTLVGLGFGAAGEEDGPDADDENPIVYTADYDPGGGARKTIYILSGDGPAKRLTDGTFDAFDPVVRKNSYCAFRHQDGTEWRITLDEAV